MINKERKKIITSIIIFFIISILSIYSASKYLNNNDLVIKQLTFYIIGIIFIIFINKLNNNFFTKYAFYIYLVNIILLILVLIFGQSINGSKAWFVIPKLGNFQPSEFMKIGLILMIARIINKFNESKNNSISDEFKLIMKVLFITFIPSILTFLEPDTGAIFMYLIIAFFMLLTSGIRYRWFIILLIVFIVLFISLIILYFNFQGIFVNIFGNDFFYRFDRLLFWSKGSGMQLNNSLTSIATSGFFGNGFNNVLIYFPEPQTDFIFATFTSCFGLVGASFLLLVIFIFDKAIINLGKLTKKKINKYIISGFLGMLIYQQIQNISMTIGMLPITGITLPFISYGGSSLLSYMIFLGIIFNLTKEK